MADDKGQDRPCTDEEVIRQSIGKALGVSEPYRGRPGYQLELQAGAWDPSGEKFAWVESHEETNPGEYVDVVHLLKIASSGKLIHEAELMSYNPYFGCDVSHLGWHGEQVSVLYTEKSATLAAVTSPGAGWRLLECVWDAVVADGVVWHATEEWSLLAGIRLPDLTYVCPLPVSQDTRYGVRLEPLGNGRLRVGLARPEILQLPTPQQAGTLPPSDRNTLFRQLREWMMGHAFGASEADLLIGSQGHGFWLPRGTASEDYSQARSTVTSAGDLLAYCWASHLEAQGRAEELHAFLRALETLAATLGSDEAEAGWRSEWDRDEGRLNLAKRHFARRSRVVLRQCVEGLSKDEVMRAPPNKYATCLDPVLNLFPRGFRDCVLELQHSA